MKITKEIFGMIPEGQLDEHGREIVGVGRLVKIVPMADYSPESYIEKLAELIEENKFPGVASIF